MTSTRIVGRSILRRALASVVRAARPRAARPSLPTRRRRSAPGTRSPRRRRATCPSLITVKIVDGQPKCDVEVAATKQAVSGEKLDGNVLTMKVSYDFGLYDVLAKVDGDSLAGTWQGGGYSGALKGTRRP